MELMDVKSAHNHRDRHAQRYHDRAKHRAKPAEAAVQAHMVCANQRRLDDIKDYPRRECGSMEPEEQWPRFRRMKKVRIDCQTEAVHRDGGNHHRHSEVEITVHKSVMSGD